MIAGENDIFFWEETASKVKIESDKNYNNEKKNTKNRATYFVNTLPICLR
jgi:hypothetical protein